MESFMLFLIPISICILVIALALRLSDIRDAIEKNTRQLEIYNNKFEEFLKEMKKMCPTLEKK